MLRPHQTVHLTFKNVREMKKTNPKLKKLIEDLSKKDEKIWKDVAQRLSKPKKIEVNLARINRYAKKGDNVLVPGKVLGYGNLDKVLTVSAFSFSKEAEKKIKNAGGMTMNIEELVVKNPKGSKIILLG